MDSRKDEDANVCGLPRETWKHIFGFFKLQTLLNTARVNKVFNELTHEECAKYSNNIYYAIGQPILVASHRNIKPNPFVKTIRQFRSDISYTEIYDSFVSERLNEVMLFKDEYDAFKYSEQLHSDKNKDLWRPAIFKVIYFGSVENQRSINFKIQTVNAEDIPMFTARVVNWDSKEFILTTNCISALRDELIPLEGILLVDYTMHSKNIMRLDYKKLNEYTCFQKSLPKAEKPERCVIS